MPNQQVVSLFYLSIYVDNVAIEQHETIKERTCLTLYQQKIFTLI